MSKQPTLTKKDQALRDRLAMQALEMVFRGWSQSVLPQPGVIVDYAYLIADAMLVARKGRCER